MMSSILNSRLYTWLQNLAFPALVLLGTTACKSPPPLACAHIRPISGILVDGTALFTQQSGQLTVQVNLRSSPPGMHGLSLHQGRTCADLQGHLNPIGAPHGAPDSALHHPGDFGNISVDTDGSGATALTTAKLTVAPGDSTVVGRALVVHQDADDPTKEPLGNAGPGIGCGIVIQVHEGSSSRCETLKEQ